MTEEHSRPAAGPGRLTLRAKSDSLQLDTLSKLLTNWLGVLNSIEREITGKRRAVTVWRIVDLSLKDGELTITIESGRGKP